MFLTYPTLNRDVHTPYSVQSFTVQHPCRRFPAAADEIGASSLLWGTDIPGLLSYATYEQLRTVVTRHCDFFTEVELAQVMGLNAMEVYWGADGDSVSGGRQ